MFLKLSITSKELRTLIYFFFNFRGFILFLNMESDHQQQYYHIPEQATKNFYKFPLDASECKSIRLLWDRWVEFWEHGDSSGSHLGINLFKLSEKLAGKNWQVDGFRTHDGKYSYTFF